MGLAPPAGPESHGRASLRALCAAVVMAHSQSRWSTLAEEVNLPDIP